MSDKMQIFLSIMAFYILLSYVLGPLVFYYTMGKTLNAAGNGFIAGSILSLLLWVMIGSKMINK
jgi:hypothetical protein